MGTRIVIWVSSEQYSHSEVMANRMLFEFKNNRPPNDMHVYPQIGIKLATLHFSKMCLIRIMLSSGIPKHNIEF